MKKIVLFILLTLSFQHAIAQEQDLEMSTEDVYSPDVKNPEFPGGLKAFYEFVYMEFDKTTPITKEGDLIVSFSINEAGEMKNIRVLRDIGDTTAFEIIRVLQLTPKWQPAMRNGKPFATTLKLPFKFVKKAIAVNPNNTQNGSPTDKNKVNSTEVQAEFKGGKDAFFDYLRKNLKLPKSNVEGKALVSFVINTEGKLIEIKILRDPSGGPAGNEIIRVLRNCPNWKPATQSGVPVRAQFTLPITLQ